MRLTSSGSGLPGPGQGGAETGGGLPVMDLPPWKLCTTVAPGRVFLAAIGPEPVGLRPTRVRPAELGSTRRDSPELRLAELDLADVGDLSGESANHAHPVMAAVVPIAADRKHVELRFHGAADRWHVELPCSRGTTWTDVAR
ncbi:hypothetical protein PV371_33240 [Streptomyces sp. TX20-6-3]|uniref:hypothetical protein n=1 Tax=Streptomyces sp. TX20-6-3 TaxID=3028705 RepID=UPI0029A59578|nr:hypothetical protein [Streptomyces sp. TX20-6-3]MDX2564491.1 hypothetical protein [Streptomyces sp. TX20-6-3]